MSTAVVANPSIQALWSALEGGDIEAVDQLTKPSILDRVLLRTNGLVDAHPEKGILKRTPLFSAASVGNAEMCKVLVRNGAEVNSMSSSDDMMELTPLHQAAINGHIETCRVLIDAGADVNQPGCHWSHYINEQSILHSAAEKGYADICQELLTAGAQVDALADGFIPLHMAAQSGATQTCLVLVDAGADINQVSFSIDDAHLGGTQHTPLHLAVLKGHSECAQSLIGAGATIEATDAHLNTPLHLASNAATVGLLLSAGANQNALNTDQFTPAQATAIPEVAHAFATWSRK